MSAGTFGTRDAAERELRRTQNEQDRTAAFDPRAGNVTVREWSFEWLATKVDVKPKTLHGYRGLIESRITPSLGDYPLNRVTAGVVDEWVGSMVAEGLSPSRIRQGHQTLGAMMKLAVRRGLISSDPSTGTALPKQKVREQRFLTPSELAALAEAMPKRLQAATWTLGLAGLRFGELAALKRDDFDVLRRRIDVSKSVVDVAGHLVVGETKNRLVRSVAIPRRLAVIANDHLTRHNSAIAFPNTRSGYLRASNFRGHVLQACAASGLDPIRTHDLRHTAAALMLAVEPDLHLVMRQLGHSSIAVTVDRYGHLLPGRVDQVADKLDAMLDDELSGGDVVAFR